MSSSPKPQETSQGSKAYLIGYSFTKYAYGDVARVRTKKDMDIQLIKVEDILGTI